MTTPQAGLSTEKEPRVEESVLGSIPAPAARHHIPLHLTAGTTELGWGGGVCGASSRLASFPVLHPCRTPSPAAEIKKLLPRPPPPAARHLWLLFFTHGSSSATPSTTGGSS